MTLSYLPRLFWLSLACFAMVHLALTAAVSAASPLLLSRAGRMRARSGARFLIALRLAPAAVALAIVTAICVPAYLLHEPQSATERTGAICVLAGLAGLLLWAVSLARAVRAAAGSARYLKGCLNTGTRLHLPGEELPVCVLGPGAPSMMLAGLARPRLLVSRETLRALTGDQLAAALRHEQAHHTSRDNLKRLLILAAPGILPGWSGLQSLERAWARLAEWAADEEAVAGDSQVSLSLASALVRVARIGGGPHPRWLLTSPIAGSEDLSARVDRLLAPPAAPPRHASRSWLTTLIVAVALAAVIFMPSEIVHAALERLMN